MAGEVMHELLVVRDQWKAMQDSGAQWRTLAVAASVAHGQGRPQLGHEWAERSLGRTGADGPARWLGGRASRVAWAGWAELGKGIGYLDAEFDF
jgi:hypothetical protein